MDESQQVTYCIIVSKERDKVSAPLKVLQNNGQ